LIKAKFLQTLPVVVIFLLGVNDSPKFMNDLLFRSDTALEMYMNFILPPPNASPPVLAPPSPGLRNTTQEKKRAKFSFRQIFILIWFKEHPLSWR